MLADGVVELREYATRGLRLLLEYAGGVGVRALEAHVQPDNGASRRVCEHPGFVVSSQFRTEMGA